MGRTPLYVLCNWDWFYDDPVSNGLIEYAGWMFQRTKHIDATDPDGGKQFSYLFSSLVATLGAWSY